MNPIAVLPVQPPSSLVTPSALAALSDEEVKDGVTTWAGRIAAGEARLMAYIGELDERRAWAVDGILSCGTGCVAARNGTERCRGTGPGRPRSAADCRAYPMRSARAGCPTARCGRSAGSPPPTPSGYIGMARMPPATNSNDSSAESNGPANSATTPRRQGCCGRRPRTGAAARSMSSRFIEDGELCITSMPAPPTVRCSRRDRAARTDLSAERSDESAPRFSRVTGCCACAAPTSTHRAAAHPARARRDRSQLTVQLDPTLRLVPAPRR